MDSHASCWLGDVVDENVDHDEYSSNESERDVLVVFDKAHELASVEPRNEINVGYVAVVGLNVSVMKDRHEEYSKG